MASLRSPFRQIWWPSAWIIPLSSLRLHCQIYITAPQWSLEPFVFREFLFTKQTFSEPPVRAGCQEWRSGWLLSPALLPLWVQGWYVHTAWYQLMSHNSVLTATRGHHNPHKFKSTLPNKAVFSWQMQFCVTNYTCSSNPVGWNFGAPLTSSDPKPLKWFPEFIVPVLLCLKSGLTKQRDTVHRARMSLP